MQSVIRPHVEKINVNSHNVNTQADNGRDEHDVSVDRVRHVHDSLHGQVQQDTGDHPDEEDRRQGAQHLGPVPPEWHRLRGRSRSHPQGEQRYHEAGEIRE